MGATVWKRKTLITLIYIASLLGSPAVTHAETPARWVELGARVHDGFGSYIALGIRIGLDAIQHLSAQPRDLDVTYYNGSTAPCRARCKWNHDCNCFYTWTKLIAG